MGKDFDELFNNFFNNEGDNNEGNKDKKSRNLIDRLNKFEDENFPGFNLHENELGEPDKVDTYKDKGYTFKRSTWELESGSIVKMEMISAPMDIGVNPRVKKKLTLDAKLEIALEDEDYEEAIRIRDKINKKDKK